MNNSTWIVLTLLITLPGAYWSFLRKSSNDTLKFKYKSENTFNIISSVSVISYPLGLLLLLFTDYTWLIKIIAVVIGNFAVLMIVGALEGIRSRGRQL